MLNSKYALLFTIVFKVFLWIVFRGLCTLSVVIGIKNKVDYFSNKDEGKGHFLRINDQLGNLKA